VKILVDISDETIRKYFYGVNVPEWIENVLITKIGLMEMTGEKVKKKIKKRRPKK
jgi:hypothetical protein